MPDRFVLERRLGSGGFGAVYVAYDRESERRVALKILVRAGASAAHRFRREFRALAGITHPNLVRLHDLYAVGEDRCFTMELVPGLHFDRWVKSDQPAPGMATTLASTGAGPVPPGFDEGRLRTALRGLASGVIALHAAGILHRDLKPSNVMVRPDGHVVILDFGLAASGVVDAHESGEVAGTPAYMSPEQAQGRPVTAASDWYAVGVMLYEALCGQLPFSGTAPDLLAARLERDPRPPRSLYPGLPEDLCALALALLQRDPGARPSARALAARLELAHAPPVAAAPADRFVGRTRELARLHAGFADARAGTPTVLEVRGLSGVGKSALVQRFLGELRAAGPVVVLEGRCYEREYVPYKAFDDIVDGLTRHLQRLPPVRAAALLPRGVREIARLFPGFRRLELLREIPERELAPDPHVARLRAFAALRELVARLGDGGQAVVLFIDDAQWADADSAALLFELLRPPEPPPILLVVADRGAGVSGPSEFLRLLAAARPEGRAHAHAQLELAPLPEDEAKALARALVGEGPDAAARAAAVAREAGGHPLFIRELARLAPGPGDELSLQRLLAARVAALDPAARAMLGVLVSAVRPLPEELVRTAGGLGAEAAHQALGQLRELGLVHTVYLRGRPALEIRHDRVRAAALEALAAEERTRSSERLAATLEAVPEHDPETIAHLYGAAGLPARAAPYAERAGDRAREALAFAQAVELYLLALEGAGEGARPAVLVKLADALADAGRGRDAAFMYVEAARLADEEARSTLHERAAVQLLRAGHITAGLDVLRPVARAHGLAVPATPARALASLLWNRALARRARPAPRRDAASVPARQLRRIDLCWALGTGLLGVDMVRAAGYQARHLRLALEAGEPYRLALALAKETMLAALEGGAALARSDELLARAEVAARSVGHPHALAWTTAAAAIKCLPQGRFAACAELSDRAVALFHERCVDIFHETGSVEVWFNLPAQLALGRLGVVARRASSCVHEAEARGDLYTLTTARTFLLPSLWLVQDRAADARREADEAIAQWGQAGFHLQHWAHLRAQCEVDLYERAGARLLARAAVGRPAMKRSLLLRLRTPRMELCYLEGRGALCAAVDDVERRPALLTIAARAFAALEREDGPWPRAHAAALRAGHAALGDPRARAGAPALFEAAEARYQALEMPLYAAACAMARGDLVGGDLGARLRAEGRARLAAAGVRDPIRYAGLLFPRGPG